MFIESKTNVSHIISADPTDDVIELPFVPYHPYNELVYPVYNSQRMDCSRLVALSVSCDKNIHWSPEDEAWVHYKQNHFQVKSIYNPPATFSFECS